MHSSALVRGLLATAVGLAAFTIPTASVAYADDPCSPSKGHSAPPACAAANGNKQAIANCPPTSGPCMVGLAGTGQEPLDLIRTTGLYLVDFEGKKREVDPNLAAQELCSIGTTITSKSGPSESVFPPNWWFC